MIQVKFKKLSDVAVIPSYGSEEAAGLDFTAIGINYDHYNNASGAYIEYETGIAAEIPEGHVGLLFPRSSIAKKDLALANSVGVIDSDYRGVINFKFRVRGEHIYNVGDRIGQLVIVPIPRVEVIEAQELNETKRGTGGWGSTGA